MNHASPSAVTEELPPPTVEPRLPPLPPRPAEWTTLSEKVTLLEQRLTPSSSPGDVTPPIEGMAEELAEARAAMESCRAADFQDVLLTCFRSFGAQSRFPFEHWPELEGCLRARGHPWPAAEMIARAEACFSAWQEECAWEAARRAKGLVGFRDYVAGWPQGRYVVQARQAMQGLLEPLWENWLRLGQPWENSLGMRFLPVPGLAGFLSIWPTRVLDYQFFVTATGRPWPQPHFLQGATHPAVHVSWHDAQAFAAWLTERERASGLLGQRQCYRLPTDLEWSLAVGLDHETGAFPADRHSRLPGAYPWGEHWPPAPGTGNYAAALKVDPYAYTSPVGTFPPNAYGLYDLSGNVWEWCADSFDASSDARVLRGGSWVDNTPGCLASCARNSSWAGTHSFNYGFRLLVASRDQDAG